MQKNVLTKKIAFDGHTRWISDFFFLSDTYAEQNAGVQSLYLAHISHVQSGSVVDMWRPLISVNYTGPDDMDIHCDLHAQPHPAGRIIHLDASIEGNGRRSFVTTLDSDIINDRAILFSRVRELLHTRGNFSLGVAILSVPENIEQRLEIRETWLKLLWH